MKHKPASGLNGKYLSKAGKEIYGVKRRFLESDKKYRARIRAHIRGDK